MQKFLRSILLCLLLAVVLAPDAALAQSHERHAALKLCKQKYRNAVRGIKYLKSRQRSARIAQARKEREECEKLAPK